MRQWKVSVCDPPLPLACPTLPTCFPYPPFASACARPKPPQASPRTMGNMSSLAQLSAAPPRVSLYPLSHSTPSPLPALSIVFLFLCYLYRYRGRFHQFSFLFSYFGNQTKGSAWKRGEERERVLARVLAAF